MSNMVYTSFQASTISSKGVRANQFNAGSLESKKHGFNILLGSEDVNTFTNMDNQILIFDNPVVEVTDESKVTNIPKTALKAIYQTGNTTELIQVKISGLPGALRVTNGKWFIALIDVRVYALVQ